MTWKEHRFLDLLIKALALIVVACAVGGVVNLVRGNSRIAWVEDWRFYIEAKAIKAGIPLVFHDDMKTIVEGDQYFVFDARPREEFVKEHIPGAISLPFDDVQTEFEHVQVLLSPEQPMVTYCSGKQCDESFLLTQFLMEQSYTNVALFVGGMEVWNEQAYEIETGL